MEYKNFESLMNQYRKKYDSEILDFSIRLYTVANFLLTFFLVYKIILT